MLRKLPAGLATRGISASEGLFVIAEGTPESVIAACSPGAVVVESGVLSVEGVALPLYRCVERPVPRPHGKKIAEEPGNLGRRAAWFQKRSR